MKLSLQKYNKNILDNSISELPILSNISLYCTKDYVPKGCLPCDGSEYSEKLFKSFYKNFIKTNYAPTCTYSDYEAEIAQYGQCGKFGVNTRITNICSNDNLIVGGNYNGDTSNIFTYKRNGDDELTISEYVSIDDSCANNNGIVSNFANGGVTINNINSNEVQFIVFETSEDVITEQHIVSFSNLYSLRISNGLLQLIQYADSDILIASCVVEPNTKYTLQIISQTNFVIINGVTKKMSNDEYIFDYLTNINSSLVFGYKENQSPFLGSLFLTLSTYASSISATEADNDYATLIENGYWSDLNNNYNGSSIGLDEYGLSVIGTPNSGDTISFETQNFFRVPLIKDGTVIQQALSDSELGKSYNAGVPNIEGQFKADRHLSSAAPSGAFAVVSGSGTTGADDTGTSQSIYYDFYASRCSTVYGNSDTVQPNAVALRHFVVIANGTVNKNMMDWSKWASSMQGKLNSDHSNDPYPYLIEISSKELLPYWYKVYSNGWCEQGSIDETAAKTVTITLLKPYISKTHYSINNSLGGELNTGSHSDYSNICSPIDGASFELKKYDTNLARYCYWETKGFIK